MSCRSIFIEAFLFVLAYPVSKEVARLTSPISLACMIAELRYAIV